MAWKQVLAKTSKNEYAAFQRGDEFTFDFVSGLKGGDTFRVGSQEYEVLKATNIAQRSEQILVETKEKNSGKDSTKPKEG
jgi:hypothetical protein